MNPIRQTIHFDKTLIDKDAKKVVKTLNKAGHETYLVGVQEVIPEADGDALDFIEHGRYRHTKEVAEMSLERNKRANRLEALAEDLGGLTEFVDGEENWYIYRKRAYYYYKFIHRRYLF